MKHNQHHTDTEEAILMKHNQHHKDTEEAKSTPHTLCPHQANGHRPENTELTFL
jgi:hypothetical protein